MSANRHRGEIEAELDGRRYRLCLTLGALAALESAYGAEDLGSLVARFSTGKLSATDLMRLIGAGLRGAGAGVSDAEVGAMRVAGGAAGFATIAAELLAATFGAATGMAAPAEKVPSVTPAASAGAAYDGAATSGSRETGAAPGDGPAPRP